MSDYATIESGAWDTGDIQCSDQIYGFSLYESPGVEFRVALNVAGVENSFVELPSGATKTDDYLAGNTLPPTASTIRQTSSVFTAGIPNFFSSDGASVDNKGYVNFYNHANGQNNLWVKFEGDIITNITQFEIGQIITRNQFSKLVETFGPTPGGGIVSYSSLPTGNIEAKNPLLYLRQAYGAVTYFGECGEAVAECGEPSCACGESSEPPGYPLVNKIIRTEPNVTSLCGEVVMECGEQEAACGFYDEFKTSFKEYLIPGDPDTWPYFLYIGGESFGNLADVPVSRKDEFETLCLQICPTQQWLGMLINYV